MAFRDAAPAAGVFVIALAWLLLLRPYGFQLEDEGLLLAQLDRASRGQVSYVDFHTGYTPGFYTLGTWVFAWFGKSATALRAVLAVVNALTAAGLTLVAARLAGRWLAPIPALLWLFFVPLYVGEFAAFNVPYPTWPVTLAWVALALTMLAWIERPRVMMLALAGVLCAAAMWLRPNAGAFTLAATTWIVVAASPRRGSLDRAAAAGGAAFMLAGVWYAFEFRAWGLDAFVHVVPALVLAALYTGPLYARVRRDEAPGAAASLSMLAAAFLVPTALWAGSLALRLGSGRFLYEVFLVGSGYQTLYYKPHPSPEMAAILVALSVLVFALGGRLVAHCIVRPLPSMLALLVAGVGGSLVVLGRGEAPEGLLRSVAFQLENASFWLAVVAAFGAVAWLALAPAVLFQRSPRARAMLVVTPLAALMYAQMFPRSDFMHQVTAVPLLAAVACGLLDRVASWWARGAWPPGWDGPRVVRGVLAAAALAVAGVALAEKIGGPLAMLRDAAPREAMPAPLDVHVEAAAGDELEAIAATIAFLDANTEAGEALLPFPGVSGLLFAAGLTNATAHDYWYQGRPDRTEEAAMVARLEAAPPRYVLTLNKGWTFFTGSAAYFTGLRGFVVRDYRLAARFGRYDVLAHRDLPVTAVATLPARPGSLTELIEPNLERRRQAAWRWMDSMTSAEAVSASLPPRRRDALLLLRGLRDGGDMRGAAWAILGFESTDARIRAEAADAMEAIVATLADARARFANDFDAQAMWPFVAPWAARAHPLTAIPRLRPFAEAVLELTGALPRDMREAAPATLPE